MLSRTLVRGGVIGELFEGNCWRGNVCGETFCSLRSHGTRFAYGRLRAQALSQPCLVMGKAGVCTEMNTIFGATFVGHWFEDAFCSLRSHGTRLSLARQSKPCLGQGEGGVFVFAPQIVKFLI